MPETNSVWIIEDDVEIREAIKDILTDECFEVCLFENGAKALASLHNGGGLPALILLDMMMPIMDGKTFRAEQLKDKNLAKIPTAVLTADGHAKKKAEILGTTDYLRKPVEYTDLVALVSRYCKQVGQPS